MQEMLWSSHVVIVSSQWLLSSKRKSLYIYFLNTTVLLHNLHKWVITVGPYWQLDSVQVLPRIITLIGSYLLSFSDCFNVTKEHFKRYDARIPIAYNKISCFENKCNWYNFFILITIMIKILFCLFFSIKIMRKKQQII